MKFLSESDFVKSRLQHVVVINRQFGTNSTLFGQVSSTQIFTFVRRTSSFSLRFNLFFIYFEPKIMVQNL